MNNLFIEYPIYLLSSCYIQGAITSVSKLDFLEIRDDIGIYRDYYYY